MHLDEHGLPCTLSGGKLDANDQLQRCGMIVAAEEILNEKPTRPEHYYFSCLKAINETHQVKPGIYVRHIGGDPANVSADQLIGALAAHVALGNTKQVLWLALRCLLRLGFAQNYKDGLSGEDRTKIPDFMLLRALPLFTRASRWLYPVAAISDLLLVLAALAAVGPVWRDDKGFTKRSPDDVDDNNTILTFAVCRFKMPTPLSYLASRIYGRLRPWNYGCRDSQVYFDDNVYHPVYGALRWYHRAENGGNPEIAEMYREICKRYFE